MIVNRLLLASVLPAASKDDYRYTISSIQILNGGPVVRATATDGHVLITATAPVDAMPDSDYPSVGPELTPAHEALIACDTAAALIKATKLPKRSPTPILAGTKIGTDAAGRMIAVTASDSTTAQTFDVTPREGSSFPAWDRVVTAAERTPAVVKVQLGLPVLKALIAAAAATDADGIVFEIPANDHTGSVIDAIRATWTPKADPQITVSAVAMPMRF